MNLRYIILILSILFNLSSFAFSSKTTVLDSTINEKFVARELVEYWEDSTSKTDLAQLILLDTKLKVFKKSNFSDLKNFNPSSSYWLRFKVQNLTDKAFFLEIFDFDIDEISFYQLENNKKINSYNVGFLKPFLNREIKHKNFLFYLTLKRGESKTYYIRFHSSKLNILEPVIRSFDRSFSYSINEYMFLGIYYGLLLLMLFYNFLYFILLRKLHYLYYILQVLGILIFQMSENGTGFQYLWGKYPELNLYIGNVGLFVCMCGMLLFANYFLELESRCRTKRGIIFILLGIRILLFCVQFIHPDVFKWEMVDLLFAQAILVIGFLEYRAGYRPAIWFVLAYSILDITFIITWLEHIGLIQSNLCSVYALNVGIVIKFIFLSISIGESIKETYKQKAEAQEKLLVEYARNNDLNEKINKELEQKVKERTIELEDRNAEIETQKDEINAINDHLEELVKTRTRELEDRNNRIKEYAFSNSHLVRGPLARILGLTIIAKNTPVEIPDIIDLIEDNAKDLDGVIREMTSILSEKD